MQPWRSERGGEAAKGVSAEGGGRRGARVAGEGWLGKGESREKAAVGE